MPGKLYIIANATGGTVNFANPESPGLSTKGDGLVIPANTVMYSGGKGGDYCLIPTCEDSGDFAAHHMSLVSADGTVNICFWKDNSQDNVVYYSTPSNGNAPAFTPNQTMPGGNAAYDQAAILINEIGGAVIIQMSNVTGHN